MTDCGSGSIATSVLEISWAKTIICWRIILPAAGNLIPQPNAQAPALVGTTIALATFAKSWINYLTGMDKMFRSAQYGPLTAATSDNQAKSMGVPVGGFYQNAGVVHVRLS